MPDLIEIAQRDTEEWQTVQSQLCVAHAEAALPTLDALLNWTIAGTLFARTGLPFTAIDAASTSVLNGYNYAPSTIPAMDLFADSTVGPLSCDSSAASTVTGTNHPCMTGSQFFSPVGTGGVATFGQQRRNQIYGRSSSTPS